jgi:hypothetical protein
MFMESVAECSWKTQVPPGDVPNSTENAKNSDAG